MKNYLYLLIISFSLISCYTYRARAEKDAKTDKPQKKEAKSAELAESVTANPQSNLKATESRSKQTLKQENFL